MQKTLNFFQKIPGLFLVKDLNGAYQFATHGLVENLGFHAKEQIIGKKDQDLWPESASQFRKLDKEILSRKSSISKQVDLFAGGFSHAYNIIGSVFSDDAGKRFVVYNIFEITRLLSDQHRLNVAKRKAEAEIQNTTRILESILDSLPGNIYWKDREGYYLGCNQYMISSSPHISDKYDIQGKTDFDLFSKEQAEELRLTDLRVMDENVVLSTEETITLNNETRMFKAIKMPLYDEKENIVGVIGNSMDITELKRTQDALVKAKLQAERANKVKSNFLAVMSHELRTPLNGILGMAQVLQKELAINQGQADKVKLIHKAGSHLLDIINDILDFSKFESDVIQLKSVRFDLREVAEEVVEIMKDHIAHKGLDVRLTVSSDFPRFIVGDETRLKQLAMNLFSNAAKFTETGFIELILKLDDENKNNLQIAVRDTGVGIAKDKLDKVFESFYQIESDLNRKYQGAGLGLAICKRIAHAMEGDIKVKSEFGRGTVFTITVPLREDVSKIDSIESIEIDANDIDLNLKILVVDDNVINVKVLLSMLSGFNCDIDVAEVGKLALDKAKANDYSVIFMDVGLPDIDGIEVTRRLRAHGEKATIIGLTAHAFESDKKRCLDAGMDFVITKPMMMDEIIRLLKSKSVA